MLHLRDVSYRFHVSGIATGTKDNSDLGIGIDIVGGDKGTSCVADDRSELDWYILKQAGCVSGPGDFSMTQSSSLRHTNLARDLANMAATSWPSTFGAPKPFAHRISSMQHRVVASTWSLVFQGREHRISALDLPA